MNTISSSSVLTHTARTLMMRPAGSQRTDSQQAYGGQSDPSTAHTRARDALLDILDQFDPDAAKTLREKAEEADQLHTQLKSVASDAQSNRKAAAREKVERIKAQLQALRMLAATNPEAAARQAARLARQLASAVREYKAAGGDASAVGGAGMVVSASVPASAGGAMSASAGSAASASVTAGDAVTTASAPAEGTSAAVPPPPTVPSLSSAAAPAGDTPTGDEPSAGEGAGDEGDVPSEGVPGSNRAADSKKADESKRDSQSTPGNDDAKFAEEVRRLKAQLKAILEAAKRHSRLEEEEAQDAVDDEVQAGNEALRSAEAALSGLGAGGLAGTVDAMPALSLLV
ncbi:hypothetical protein F1188_00435 [Roseospira marina]|uniref:Uncharacterized protein n=1 Tax=Roseospira marina TaxID=140057 RepID=A0A5M6IG85_9PROT|nr:hypothetical protein [Roseospira marina]KAA5607273.1 hypothetical protein F1188_00435 [Roseospira marina]MBB4312573.1 ElaB/YqjD/DUF883 family membrane-anchored ribosome-binding protein [Roseospira marina]MBB5085411.1 ElaB/YqjD/DUF883 family membrane-anchored ribosome-binding protein [Roseospira marina]